MKIMTFPGDAVGRQERVLVDSCCLWPHDLAIPSPMAIAAGVAASGRSPAQSDHLQKPSLAPAPNLFVPHSDFCKGPWALEYMGHTVFDGFVCSAVQHGNKVFEDQMKEQHLYQQQQSKDFSWECADSVSPAPGNEYQALPLSPPFSPRKVDLDLGPPETITFIVLEDEDDGVSLLNDDPDDDDDDILPQPTYDVLLTLFQDIYKDECDDDVDQQTFEEDDDVDDEDDDVDDDDDDDLDAHRAGAGAA